MGILGKNDAELKQRAGELDKQRIELDNRESELKSARSSFEHEQKLFEDMKTRFETDREELRKKTKKDYEDIASENAKMEKQRVEILKLEATAKAGFVEKQREAFKEVIEKRIAELDARQEKLNDLESDIAKKMATLYGLEGEIAKRELAVTEREQKADAGFADKAKALADEATRQYQANQAEAKRLREHADAIAKEHQSLEAAKAKLVQREQTITVAEQKRDAGFANERAILDAELRDKRAEMEVEILDAREKRLFAFEDEIAKLRTKRLEDIAKAEQAERDRIRIEIDDERKEWTKLQENARKHQEDERLELDRLKGALSALQSEIESRKTELEANERMLEQKDRRLEQQWQKRNEQFDSEIQAQIEERHKSFEDQEKTSKAEIERLREGLRIQTEFVGAFDQLKRQLGDKDPAEIIRELNSKTDELKQLREELATRPTEEIRERCEAMTSELERLRVRNDELQRQVKDNAAAVAETEDLRHRNSKLDAEKRSLESRANIFEDGMNEAQAELKRLRSAYERPAEVSARYKEIEMPHIKAGKAQEPKKIDHPIDEITWLTGVGNACNSYGLHFNPRILKAFHTALKTAEWSPLTILAGVSGTGKSELPRLYSHFGGLMFEPLSVQPNWDSQESMLGFFNSIDNKFDAQPLLRFLAQSQKKWIEKTDQDEGYPGLQNAVCLVLLDEMNLAHPELYFAEFLSKLELRRGMKGSEVPNLPVKIGAGMPPYQLPLGRNILWAGTMNQDETTKSLSDKVLDRSIVIHFPRPTELKRRLKLAPLDEKNRGPLLHKVSWQDWLAQSSSFQEDEVRPFKKFIEEMNMALAVTGRAIGHRVWQSVEYYMANYPDVRAAQNENDKDALQKAMHIAFEDQLVQKVMPKLRGIDTRGKSKTECLDKILTQINAGIGDKSFNLAEDFDRACELGYGQFIWQSANYLKDEPKKSPDSLQAVDIEETGETLQQNEEPPEGFRPNDSARGKRWEKMSPEQRDKWIKNYNPQPQQ